MLKIADMGQSRILEAGQTGMDTGTMGGTMGWMSPEEIKWDQVCPTSIPHACSDLGGIRVSDAWLL